ARLGDPAHRQRVVSIGAIRIRLACVDGGPRRRVHDDIRPERPDCVEDGVAISHVEPAVVGGGGGVARLAARRPDVAGALTAGAGDDDLHRVVAQAEPSATGARSRNGSHHAWLAAYQSMVAATPWSNGTVGVQPSSVRIFVQSRT